MKNSYAVKLLAAKAAYRAEEKSQIVKEIVQLMHGVYALAMNQALESGRTGCAKSWRRPCRSFRNTAT